MGAKSDRWPDWAITNLADEIKDGMFEKHRGTFRRDSRIVIFGNDGFDSDERTRKQVELLREWAASVWLTEDGFGKDSESGYTWVLVLGGSTSIGLEAVENALWRAHSLAVGKPLTDDVIDYQRNLASDPGYMGKTLLNRHPDAEDVLVAFGVNLVPAKILPDGVIQSSDPADANVPEWESVTEHAILLESATHLAPNYTGPFKFHSGGMLPVRPDPTREALSEGPACGRRVVYLVNPLGGELEDFGCG